MNKKILLISLALLLALSLVVAGCPAPVDRDDPVKPPEIEEVTWNVATSAEGSGGYITNLAMARVATKHVPGLTYVSVPTAGSTASNRFFGTGTGEVVASYPNIIDIGLMYRRQGVYHDIKWLPYQALWHTSASLFMITKADRTDIMTLEDLRGKNVFLMGVGTSIHALYKMAFEHLGLWDDMTVRDMGTMDAADALILGTIDAVGATIGGFETLPAWVKNIDALIDIKAVVPSAEEREAIATGLPVSVAWDEAGTVARAFGQSLEVDKVWTFSSWWGNAFSPHTCPDLMYQMVKAFDEHVEELVGMTPLLAMWARYGVGPITVIGIKANPDIPVHAGVARFLKEQGLWQEEWIVGEYIELSPAGKEKLWRLYGLAE